MGKFGVGVGEDFPVDEGAAAKEGGTDEKDCGEPGDQREAWRQWREQKRQWRHQMYAEWRAHKHAMHECLRRRFRGEQVVDGLVEDDEWRLSRGHHLVIAALALIGLTALFGHSRHHN